MSMLTERTVEVAPHPNHSGHLAVTDWTGGDPEYIGTVHYRRGEWVALTGPTDTDPLGTPSTSHRDPRDAIEAVLVAAYGTPDPEEDTQ